jgi:hypothetical protein
MQTKELEAYKSIGSGLTSGLQDIRTLTRPYVTTEEAAAYLNRKPQTLRCWSMDKKVIEPLRVHGRLAWPVDKLREILCL